MRSSSELERGAPGDNARQVRLDAEDVIRRDGSEVMR
jgi:hypothetical protein